MSSSSSSLLTTEHSSSYQTPPHPPPGPGHKTVRRRNRVINSCLECRRRKLKCSRDYPCAACMKHGRKCVFLDTALDSIGLHKLTEIKNRVGSLEDLLETEVAARSQRHSSEDSSVVDHRARSNTDSPPVRTRIKVEDLSGTANLAPNYENDTDDEIADLGVRIGMLRMNERIGGMLRSSITKEVRPYSITAEMRSSHGLEKTSLTGCTARTNVPGRPTPSASLPIFPSRYTLEPISLRADPPLLKLLHLLDLARRSSGKLYTTQDRSRPALLPVLCLRRPAQSCRPQAHVRSPVPEVLDRRLPLRTTGKLGVRTGIRRLLCSSRQSASKCSPIAVRALKGRTGRQVPSINRVRTGQGELPEDVKD